MARKRRDLSGTARCLDCAAAAEYVPSRESKHRTLVLKHEDGCPQKT